MERGEFSLPVFTWLDVKLTEISQLSSAQCAGGGRGSSEELPTAWFNYRV